MFVLALALGLLQSTASYADIGFLLLQPIKTLGFLTRAGHAATYLSNICPDGSPVRMRLCHAGEHGGVVSKYTPISETGDYDWAIVPFEVFLNGIESADLAPIVATERLHAAIEAHQFTPLFASAIARRDDGTLPDGEWRTTLATRFERTLYNFSIPTTIEEDRAIVDAFNALPNTSHFNFFWDNCSDQAKQIFALVLPPSASISDRTRGLTMETPKGLAKAIVDLAARNPGVRLRVEHYPQTPGASPRSAKALFPLENVYRNPSFAPYWYFEGFREFALGAMIYHQLVSRFSVERAFRTFSANGTAPASASDWRRVGREFTELSITASRGVAWPADLRALLAAPAASGRISRALLHRFDADGRFDVGEHGRGPWMTLPIGEWGPIATGVSAAEISDGDARLAILVLAAAIDYNLDVSDDRRADIREVDRLLALLRANVLRTSPAHLSEAPPDYPCASRTCDRPDTRARPHATGRP